MYISWICNFQLGRWSWVPSQLQPQPSLPWPLELRGPNLSALNSYSIRWFLGSGSVLPRPSERQLCRAWVPSLRSSSCSPASSRVIWWVIGYSDENASAMWASAPLRILLMLQVSWYSSPSFVSTNFNLRRVDLVTYLPLEYEATIQGTPHSSFGRRIKIRF